LTRKKLPAPERPDRGAQRADPAQAGPAQGEEADHARAGLGAGDFGHIELVADSGECVVDGVDQVLAELVATPCGIAEQGIRDGE
jgi:hypothetical protein